MFYKPNQFIYFHRLFIKSLSCFLIIGMFILKTSITTAQSTTWSLKNCIEYAHNHNIRIQQAGITVQESKKDETQSIASLFPSVTATATSAYSMQRSQNTMGEYISENSFNGRYTISANVTLFNGLKQYNNIRQQKLTTLSKELNLEDIKNEITISITKAYMQILYMQESVKNAEKTIESSKAQLELSQALLAAGSISISNFAQVSAQFSSDNYQLVTAKNNLNQQVLQLKQLLELGINDTLQIIPLTINEQDILTAIPDKVSIYNKALQIMPEIKNSELNLQIANLSYKMAKSSYFPTLTANASLGTGNWFDSDKNFGSQLSDNYNQNVSLNLSIPIFNGLQTHISTQKAKLNRQSVALNQTSAEKELLATIESLYNDAIDAQSQYNVAVEQFKALQSSYELVEEQYKLGLKNTVEFLVEKNKYISSQQAVLQAKFTTILAIKLLNFYQGIPIE